MKKYIIHYLPFFYSFHPIYIEIDINKNTKTKKEKILFKSKIYNYELYKLII